MKHHGKYCNIINYSLWHERRSIMRKYLSLALAVLFLFAGCRSSTGDLIFKPKMDIAASDNNRSDRDLNEIKVVTSIYPVYITTLNITRDISNITVTNLVPTTVWNVKEYQLTPENLKILEQADVFVVNGAGIESFMGRVRSLLPELEIVNLSQSINYPKTTGETFNQYIWLDISNTIVQLEKLTDYLCRQDPANEEKYKINQGDYYVRLEMMLDRYLQTAEMVRDNNVAVMHDGLKYIAQNMSLNVVYVVDKDMENQSKFDEAEEIIAKITESGACTLLVDSSNSSEIVSKIAEESGIKLCSINTLAATNEEGPVSYSAYINAMRDNINALEEALIQKPTKSEL